MATARVVSNHSHSTSLSPPQSSEGSGSSGSHKSLSPLNLSALNLNAALDGASEGNEPSDNPTNGSNIPTQQATYTREEVFRLMQNTLRSLHRDQLRAQHTASGAAPPRVSTPECQVMKPRVHLYEHHPHASPQVSICANRSMVATLELPGLTKADIAITARPNGDLVITGERRPLHLQPSYLQYISSTHGVNTERKNDPAELTGRPVYNELKFGRFQRIFRLPEGADPTRITASMDEGMLSICWPLPCTGPLQLNNNKLRQGSSPRHNIDERMQDVPVN